MESLINISLKLNLETCRCSITPTKTGCKMNSKERKGELFIKLIQAKTRIICLDRLILGRYENTLMNLLSRTDYSLPKP